MCYSLLGTVQHLWRKVPTEDDDDYIANPKPSGYQSLHTAVIGELPGRPHLSLPPNGGRPQVAPTCAPALLTAALGRFCTAQVQGFSSGSDLR